MFRFVITLSLLCFLSACSSTRGYPDRPDRQDLKLQKLQEKYFLPGVDVLAVYHDPVETTNQRVYRNKVVYGRMLAIDMQFQIFKQEMYGEGVKTTLSLDVAGVLVGGAGSVVTNADASKILSALSGGIAGTSTAINKNLYFEKTLPALIALMDAERLKVRAGIFEGLSQDTDVYPLGQALSELETYLEVGSIPGAIASLTAVAGAEKTEAKDKIEAVRTSQFVDPTAQKRVDDALDIIDAMPAGNAWEVLKAPPSALDNFVLTAVKARLGGTDLSSASAILSGAANDANAKSILKMIVVLIDDRSEENLSKWQAAIKAQS
ncbi:MAG: hypothetical protein ABJV04_19790 [Aliiglaciecola sp.]|uniref:hypothetical protein n=1 Tax=Aliiglaciecola sp. TaxID=1872441 RepID=UPI0032988CA4